MSFINIGDGIAKFIGRERGYSNALVAVINAEKVLTGYCSDSRD